MPKSKTKKAPAKTKDTDICVGFKTVRPNGRDFYSNSVDYAAALTSGEWLVHPDPQPETGEVCGRGYHVSDTPQLAIGFAERSLRPWRYFEVRFTKNDVIEQDERKKRLSRLRVVREITVQDIFGPDFADRLARVRTEIESWKSIAWLKPPQPVEHDQIRLLVGDWREAIAPWLAKGKKLPSKVRIVTEYTAAAAAADADDADDAAAAAAAADAAADAARIHWYLRWYVSPRYGLWRFARWQIAGMTQPNSWEPLVKLWKLGCLPIGYSGGAFVVFCPESKGKVK